jgi:hypothetical protein
MVAPTAGVGGGALAGMSAAHASDVAVKIPHDNAAPATSADTDLMIDISLAPLAHFKVHHGGAKLGQQATILCRHDVAAE